MTKKIPLLAIVIYISLYTASLFTLSTIYFSTLGAEQVNIETIDGLEKFVTDTSLAMVKASLKIEKFDVPKVVLNAELIGNKNLIQSILLSMNDKLSKGLDPHKDDPDILESNRRIKEYYQENPYVTYKEIIDKFFGGKDPNFCMEYIIQTIINNNKGLNW